MIKSGGATMGFETVNVEFKSRFTEEIYKEVIAFANTDGGIIYVGIDNEGNAIGLADVDDEYTRITNGIRDAVMPDATMCVRFTVQDNRVVRIAVNEGTNKLLPQKQGHEAERCLCPSGYIQSAGFCRTDPSAY